MGDLSADGTVEQGGDGRHAELRRFEYAGDGCSSHCLSDLRSAAQRPAGHARSGRQFRLYAPWCVRMAKVLWLDEPFGVGLLLLGCAAGAPFLPKLAQLAKGNLPFGVGAMVLLMVITVTYLPIVLPLLLPGVAVNRDVAIWAKARMFSGMSGRCGGVRVA